MLNIIRPLRNTQAEYHDGFSHVTLKGIDDIFCVQHVPLFAFSCECETTPDDWHLRAY